MAKMEEVDIVSIMAAIIFTSPAIKTVSESVAFAKSIRQKARQAK